MEVENAPMLLNFHPLGDAPNMLNIRTPTTEELTAISALVVAFTIARYSFQGVVKVMQQHLFCTLMFIYTCVLHENSIANNSTMCTCVLVIKLTFYVFAICSTHCPSQRLILANTRSLVRVHGRYSTTLSFGRGQFWLSARKTSFGTRSCVGTTAHRWSK